MLDNCEVHEQTLTCTVQVRRIQNVLSTLWLKYILMLFLPYSDTQFNGIDSEFYILFILKLLYITVNITYMLNIERRICV